MKVLFVCMGNICRSPIAQGVLEALLAQAGLSAQVLVDSAGTHGFHSGSPPDRRAQQAAARRGIDLGAQRAREVTPEDFQHFDLVLAMDEHNLRSLHETCPPEHTHKLQLFLSFAPQATSREVPDPYYGGAQGFEHVLDLAEQAAAGVLAELRRRL